jgi:uncharacterized RDD family membrane protein YckC
MKCPKCHYLSFDPEPRCRNCGYTLALDPDLEIHPDPPQAQPTLADLALRDVPPPADADAVAKARPVRRAPASPPPSEPRPSSFSMPGPFDQFTVGPGEPIGQDPPLEIRDSVGTAPPRRSPPAEGPASPSPDRPAGERRRPQIPSPTTELPLFVRGLEDRGGQRSSAAEGTPVAAESPRHPVAGQVPRAPAAPVPGGPARRPSRRPEPTPPPIGPLDRDLLEGLQRIEEKARREAVAELDRSAATPAPAAARRVAAAAIDALLLAGVAAGVVSMTLRWVDLDWTQWTDLPFTPLAVFGALITVGYLFMFTAAGGQTAGKMLMDIRVVDAGHARARVTLRQALSRSLLTIPSVLAFGAGFLPALTGEHLALHDRLTRTRVVRA